MLALWNSFNASHLGHGLFENVIPDAALFDDSVQMTGTEEEEAARRALIAAPEITADDHCHDREDDEDEDSVLDLMRTLGVTCI